jgi:hypothetical protein
MKKILFFLLTLTLGFLLGELLRRPKMKRLQVLETKEAETKAQYAEYEREWKRELANMPFEERMNWELFEASLKLDGYIKDENDESSD